MERDMEKTEAKERKKGKQDETKNSRLGNHRISNQQIYSVEGQPPILIEIREADTRTLYVSSLNDGRIMLLFIFK